MYDRIIDWYKVAEAKAQLILTVNGIFASVAFGVATSSASGVRALRAGPETWILLGTAAFALCAAIVCAVSCLLSRHQFNRSIDFAQMGVDPDDPSTFGPEVLWYFGHIARLPWAGVVAQLQSVDESFERKALTYNVHGLAVVVLRKHRIINGGWVFTAIGLVALVIAAVSFVVRRSA